MSLQLRGDSIPRSLRIEARAQWFRSVPEDRRAWVIVAVDYDSEVPLKILTRRKALGLEA
jgi:hypothetical protein